MSARRDRHCHTLRIVAEVLRKVRLHGVWSVVTVVLKRRRGPPYSQF